MIYPSRDEAYDGVIGVSGISGSIEQGGWSCQLTAKGDLSFLLNARDLQEYIPISVHVDTYFEIGFDSWERKKQGLIRRPRPTLVSSTIATNTDYLL